jgi:uncharacterized damage-inducible protein DinB
MDMATIAALYEYNSWANGRVLEASSPLSPSDFTRDLGSGYGSVRDTLTHIAWGEWIWLRRSQGISPKLVFQPADFADVGSLRERLRDVERERSGFLLTLTHESLLREVEYRNVRGETWRYPLWQQLYHVVNHSTYHRGQVAILLRQLGLPPSATDFLVYYDEGNR